MDKLIYEPPRAPRLANLAERSAWRPENTQGLEECIRTARADKTRLHAMGGGRHIRRLPASDAVILDLRHLNGVLDWDSVSLLAHVDAGITIRKLADYLARRDSSLASWRREHPTATVGGLLATYQPVPRELWNGSIREVCLGVTCVSAAGDHYEYVPAPRKAAGPDLRYLFMGAEGRFGVITEAWLGVAPAAETAKFYAVKLDSPQAALSFIGDAWGTGLRVPNALYSGAGDMLWLLLEGSRDYVAVMEGILLQMAQRHSASLLPRDPADYYEPSEGDLRAGADPVMDRPEDQAGAIAIWGNLGELAALPSSVWEVGVLYDIGPHQASLWVPAGSAGVNELFGSYDLERARVFWFDGAALLAPMAGDPTPAEIALAKAMDPDAIFGHGGQR